MVLYARPGTLINAEALANEIDPTLQVQVLKRFHKSVTRASPECRTSVTQTSQRPGAGPGAGVTQLSLCIVVTHCCCRSPLH
eukprot:5273678-Pyramimonas_sp.AAC.1